MCRLICVLGSFANHGDIKSIYSPNYETLLEPGQLSHIYFSNSQGRISLESNSLLKGEGRFRVTSLSKATTSMSGVCWQAGTSIVRSSTVTRHAAPMGQCTGPHLSIGSIYYNAEVYPYSVWRAPPERRGLPSVQWALHPSWERRFT